MCPGCNTRAGIPHGSIVFDLRWGDPQHTAAQFAEHSNHDHGCSEAVKPHPGKRPPARYSGLYFSTSGGTVTPSLI